MKVGIYGGTFDPVHNGHIIIATMLLEMLNLDKMIIMPAYIPPHKRERKRVDFFKRFSWLKQAFEGVKKIEISDFEGKKRGISYTFDTVTHFEKMYSKLIYIIGEDNFLTIDKWYRYEELINKVELWVYPRNCGFDPSTVLERLKNVSKKNINVAREVPLIQISSTMIRKRIERGLTIKGYVPSSLEEDIKKSYSMREGR